MNILILKTKYENFYLNASNEEKAFLKAFEIFDLQGYYECMDNLDQKILFEEAKSGNGKSAKKLLLMRQRYEYEEVELEELIEVD